jgi:RimJ/RimL family protein N-acetyltransferase
MRLSFDRETVVAWANKRLTPACDPKTSTAIGVIDPKTDKIIAAAVFHNFKGHDVEIGFAADSPRWAQRGVIRAIFHYVFIQLGCSRLTTITAETNHRARKLNEGLGFKLEGVHPSGMSPGVTAVSYGMEKENCKWL